MAIQTKRLTKYRFTEFHKFINKISSQSESAIFSIHLSQLKFYKGYYINFIKHYKSFTNKPQ